MARTLLAGVIVAVALAGVAPATGKELPFLRSASVDARHVVLRAQSDLRPVNSTVAELRRAARGGLLEIMRRETINSFSPC